ncbi:MAG: hypothetical protein HZA15_17090 [Nitrospirae bacterium]|nr:hypothetical protein [Nitrospirota bacterium]
MEKKFIAVIVVAFMIGVLMGFKTSSGIPIQPGYFEKQEAPAYGSSETKAIGSEFGKEYEEHFKDLYKAE